MVTIATALQEAKHYHYQRQVVLVGEREEKQSGIKNSNNSFYNVVLEINQCRETSPRLSLEVGQEIN